MNRLLVTGASGFIGRHVLPLLAHDDWELHATSRTGRSVPGVRTTWHAVDLRSPADAVTSIESIRPTHLLHLAWNTEHDRYWTAADNDEWADATIALAQAFAACGGHRFVGVGTCAEYDWTALDGPCAEDATPLAPHTPYGRAKLRAWRGVEQACSGVPEISAAWGRLFFVYGPGEDDRRLIPSVVRALGRGERPRVTAGTQRRDFLHVSDAARAFATLLRSRVAGPINVASGEAIRVRDIVELLCRLAGRPGVAEFGALPLQPGEPPLIVADVARLRAVGWRREVPLERGLSAALANEP
jgi:nucleoside-diphosphate-sugar epimerase